MDHIKAIITKNVRDLYSAGLLTFNATENDIEKIMLLYSHTDNVINAITDSQDLHISDEKLKLLTHDFSQAYTIEGLGVFNSITGLITAAIKYKENSQYKKDEDNYHSFYNSEIYQLVLKTIDIPNFVKWICKKTNTFSSIDTLKNYLAELIQSGKLSTKNGQVELVNAISNTSETVRANALSLLNQDEAAFNEAICLGKQSLQKKHQLKSILENPALRDYYLDFQQFLFQSFSIAMTLSSGEVQSTTSLSQNVFDTILSMASSAVSSIPGASILINAINTTANYIKDERQKNKLNLIVGFKASSSPMMIEELFELVAREVTLHNEKIIIQKRLETKTAPLYASFTRAFNRVTLKKELSAVSTLAAKDVETLLKNFIEDGINPKNLPDKGEAFAYYLVTTLLPFFKKNNLLTPAATMIPLNSTGPIPSNVISEVIRQLQSALARISLLEQKLGTSYEKQDISFISNNTETNPKLAQSDLPHVYTEY